MASEDDAAVRISSTHSLIQVPQILGFFPITFHPGPAHFTSVVFGSVCKQIVVSLKHSLASSSLTPSFRIGSIPYHCRGTRQPPPLRPRLSKRIAHARSCPPQRSTTNEHAVRIGAWCRSLGRCGDRYWYRECAAVRRNRGRLTDAARRGAGGGTRERWKRGRCVECVCCGGRGEEGRRQRICLRKALKFKSNVY